MDRCVDLASRADHLGMVGMADHHQGAPGLGIAPPLNMDLGDEWTGGVDHGQPARRGVFLNRARNAVRAKYGRGAGGNFVELVDEHRSEAAQPVDDMAIVDDLVPHIDRRSI